MGTSDTILVETLTWTRHHSGLATIFCSPLCYGLARIRGSSLYTYQVGLSFFLGPRHLAKVFIIQIIYLFFGLITVIVGVGSYFLVSDSPAKAKFLTPEDRLKAVERLKANQQGKSVIATWGLSPRVRLTPFDCIR